jgi:hypothetical protein
LHLVRNLTVVLGKSGKVKAIVLNVKLNLSFQAIATGRIM